MDDPVLAENSDNPEQQAILVWFNNINHYWAIRRSPRPACELRVALGTELLWAKPADWPRFRLNPPSPDVADSAEQTPKRTPPGGGSLLPVPTRKSKRGRVAKRHSSTLETAKGQRSSMLRDFVTEHSLHERPVHEWPRACPLWHREISALAAKLGWTQNGVAPDPKNPNGTRNVTERTRAALKTDVEAMQAARRSRTPKCVDGMSWGEGANQLCGHCGAKLQPGHSYRPWDWWLDDVGTATKEAGTAPAVFFCFVGYCGC
jgi:hypothetical protein